MPRDLAFRGPPAMAVAENATTPTGRLGGVVWSTTERCYLTWDGSAWVNDLRTGTYPAIRPSLSLDFANTKVLDPRITFSRASTATFYDGRTVAKAEENLLTYSQQFENWTTTNASVTTNTGVAPDGTTTADLVTANGASGTHSVRTLTTATPNTQVFSVYVKAGTNNYLQFYMAASSNVFANFDVTAGAGAVGTKGLAVTSSSIVDVGNGWFRCVAVIEQSAANTCYLNIVSSASAVYAESNTLSTTLLIWGAQLEQRSTVTAYTPTTTQPITNYIPVLQTAAANVARFDHNPVTGESLGLLIEEQRRNLLLRSQEFENASWAPINVTRTADQLIAPDGTLTADLLAPTAQFGGIWQGATVAASTAYTISVYAKAHPSLPVTTRTTLSFYDLTGLVVMGTARFTWSGGVPSFNAVTGNGTNATVAHVGNGWYRLSFTSTSSANTSHRVYIYPDELSTASFGQLFVWGAQLEAGAFATSYIPTGASQVTRSADAATMTGMNFSSWYRQGEGTLYAEAIRSSFAGNDVVFAAVSDATVSNTFELYKPGNASSFQLYAAVGNVAQASPALLSVLTVNVPFKAVGAYRTNDIRGAANGALTAADTSALIPVVNQLALGSRNTTGAWNGHIRKVAYWPTRLPDAQLQALTTL